MHGASNACRAPTYLPPSAVQSCKKRNRQLLLYTYLDGRYRAERSDTIGNSSLSDPCSIHSTRHVRPHTTDNCRATQLNAREPPGHQRHPDASHAPWRKSRNTAYAPQKSRAPFESARDLPQCESWVSAVRVAAGYRGASSGGGDFASSPSWTSPHRHIQV